MTYDDARVSDVCLGDLWSSGQGRKGDEEECQHHRDGNGKDGFVDEGGIEEDNRHGHVGKGDPHTTVSSMKGAHPSDSGQDRVARDGGARTALTPQPCKGDDGALRGLGLDGGKGQGMREGFYPLVQPRNGGRGASAAWGVQQLGVHVNNRQRGKKPMTT